MDAMCVLTMTKRMKLLSVSGVLSSLACVWIASTFWTFAQFFLIDECDPTTSKQRCLSLNNEFQQPLQLILTLKQMSIYYIPTSGSIHVSKLKHLITFDNFTFTEPIKKDINVTIPSVVSKNGSLTLAIFLTPKYLGNPLNVVQKNRVLAIKVQTTYAHKVATAYNLMGESKENQTIKPTTSSQKKIAQCRSQLTINILHPMIVFNSQKIHANIINIISMSGINNYNPIVYVNSLTSRISHLVPLDENKKEVPLNIVYEPISIGKLRLFIEMEKSIEAMYNLGFSEKDTDEIRNLLTGTKLYMLALTVVISIVHMLFDILAFKNDINHWKQRKDMIGLSSKTVMWRCITTFVIFLYLHDQKTSMLILVPSGIGSLIEFWKLYKAFKVKIQFNGGILPSFSMGGTSAEEKQTQEFDGLAMYYLSWAMYPLCIGGGIYSLIYTPHTSWYSWCIKSMVNGIYMFGFLFMLPQLFVNYKLKSVAHLPWKVFMYKAFNTFIDDIFAFIITMPTAHRLACFRDDFIFLIYLYQRWLYPVDKTRVNEFGQQFEEKKEDKDKPAISQKPEHQEESKKDR